MSMALVAQALAQGYSIYKIIDKLIQKDRIIGPKIQEALAAGYTKDQIADFLKRSSGTLSERQGMLQGMTEAEKYRGLTYRQNEADKALKTAAIAAPVALGAVAAAPAIGSALRGVSPAALQMVANRFPGLAHLMGMQQGPGQQPIGGSPGTPTITPGVSPQITPAAAAVQASAPQPAAIPSPGVAAPQIPSAGPAVDQAAAQLTGNIPTIIKSVVQSGYKDPKTIVQIFETLYPGFLKKFEKENGTSFEEAVAEFLATNPMTEQPSTAKGPQPESPGAAQAETASSEQLQAVPEIEMNLPPDVQKMTSEPAVEAARAIEEPKPEEARTPNIGEMGATLDGNIGTVRAIRRDSALIEDDKGKLHKVKAGDLIPEPEQVKKAKIEIDLDSIPEKDRSAMLNEVYVPKDRRHVTVKFNTGKSEQRYIYWRKDGQPVDQDLIEKLRVGSQVPVSDGESFWGAWTSKEADSRGTVAFHELTKVAQEEGKEDDPSKPYWFIREEEVYTHPYIAAHKQKLREEEKRFNEARKKKK